MIVKQNWGDKCLSRVSERESKHVYERGTERRAASGACIVEEEEFSYLH